MEGWGELVLDVPEGGTETIDRSISDPYCAILNLAFKDGYERSTKPISEIVDTYFKLLQYFRDDAIEEKQAILDMYLKGGERHEIMRDLVRIDVEHANDLGRTIYWKEHEKQQAAYTGVTIGSLRRYAAAIAAVALFSVGSIILWANSTVQTLEDKFMKEAADQRTLTKQDVDKRMKPLEDQARAITDEIKGIKETADGTKEYAGQAARESRRMRRVIEELAGRFGVPIPEDGKNKR